MELDHLDVLVGLSVSLSTIAQGEFWQDSANLFLELDKSDNMCRCVEEPYLSSLQLDMGFITDKKSCVFRQFLSLVI